MACLSPRGAVTWYRTMLSDPDAAQSLELRLNRFLERHIGPLQAAGYSNAALDKTLAAVGGWAPIGTRVRWPYRSVPPEAISALRARAIEELPELLPEGARRG